MDPSSSIDDSFTTSAGTPAFGRYIGGSSCIHWTTNAAASAGAIVQADGSTTTGACNIVRPLACCNAVTQTQFVGFTSASAVMSAGGRPAMHIACAAEYPGARMCFSAQYILSASPTPVPASGAWMDPSADVLGGFTTSTGAPGFGRYIGGSSCIHWTTNAAASAGVIVQTDGSITTGACNVARKIACCSM